MKRLTLEEREEVGFVHGLWRTYAGTYGHAGLNQLKVPKFEEELDSEEKEALKAFRENRKQN